MSDKTISLDYANDILFELEKAFWDERGKGARFRVTTVGRGYFNATNGRSGRASVYLYDRESNRVGSRRKVGPAYRNRRNQIGTRRVSFAVGLVRQATVPGIKISVLSLRGALFATKQSPSCSEIASLRYSETCITCHDRTGMNPPCY